MYKTNQRRKNELHLIMWPILGPVCQPKVGILDLYLVMFMVCPSVCLLVTRMYCGKTAGPFEMPFAMWGGVDRSNHILDGGPDPPW